MQTRRTESLLMHQTDLTVGGDWEVQVVVSPPKAGAVPRRQVRQTVVVPPPSFIQVEAERADSLPLFNPSAWGGWQKGATLQGVRAHECTARYALDPTSLEVRSGPDAHATTFERGSDYEADLEWGSLGRLAGGRIGENQPVYIRYRYAQSRIDSIVLTPKGRVALRKGRPHIAVPRPPRLRDGAVRLANIWVNGRLPRLTPDSLFPILETEYSEPVRLGSTSAAEGLLPDSLRRLEEGLPLKVLAWGDSVTAGLYLTRPRTMRWQAQFAAHLKERFPQAQIELVTEAWGGRNTDSYLAEPAGSIHNYREKVLAQKPHLIVSEFVNDASMNPDQVNERYGQLLADFRAIGAEWIILTPHYIRPDWMGLGREREIDDDPRPYVIALRAFARQHNVAMADAAARYGRLWRQGIPYSSLMHNTINHPDVRGMQIFADSLMALFPEK